MSEIVLRHKNGGGKIHGWRTEVSEDTFLAKDAEAWDGSTIISAHIERSTILKGSEVFQSRIVGSALSRSKVRGSGVFVLGSGLHFADIATKESITINHCSLQANMVIRDKASLHWVDVIGGNAWVGGDASLMGAVENRIQLHSKMHIHTGTWRRAPRYINLGGPSDEQGLDFGLTECTNGRAHIGCKCLPMKRWLQHGKDLRLSQRAGWRVELVKQAALVFEEWLDTPARTDGAIIY